jgi:hypothetical protein
VVVFPHTELGIKLQDAGDGRAVVRGGKLLLRRDLAEHIAPGDVVIGVGAGPDADPVPVSSYGETISLVSSVGRPLKLRFARPSVGAVKGTVVGVPVEQQQQQQQQQKLWAVHECLLPRVTAYYEDHNPGHLDMVHSAIR